MLRTWIRTVGENLITRTSCEIFWQWKSDLQSLQNCHVTQASYSHNTSYTSITAARVPWIFTLKIHKKFSQTQGPIHPLGRKNRKNQRWTLKKSRGAKKWEQKQFFELRAQKSRQRGELPDMIIKNNAYMYIINNKQKQQHIENQS